MKLRTLIASMIVATGSLTAQAGVFEPVKDSQVPSGMSYNVQQPEVEDPTLFSGMRVAILASHGVEESEITFPYEFLKARGAHIDIVVPDWTAEGVVAVQFLKPSLFVKGTKTFKSAQSETYDLMVLTGGAWNAQVVRTDGEALKLINTHFAANRPLAAICAGTSVLINAGLAKNRRLTGSPTVAGDLINAGANFVDQAAVYSRNLVTSRSPNDLPQFVQGLEKLLLAQ